MHDTGLPQPWYNWGMSIDFGTGPTLQEFSPWLRDPEARREMILNVTERNSVIEGLPPFTAEFRARLRSQLAATSEPQPAPAGSRPPAGDSLS